MPSFFIFTCLINIIGFVSFHSGSSFDSTEIQSLDEGVEDFDNHLTELDYGLIHTEVIELVSNIHTYFFPQSFTAHTPLLILWYVMANKSYLDDIVCQIKKTRVIRVSDLGRVKWNHWRDSWAKLLCHWRGQTDSQNWNHQSSAQLYESSLNDHLKIQYKTIIT